MNDLRNLGERAVSVLQRLRTVAIDQRRGKLARVVEVHSLSVSSKLAVVEFSGQTLLLSVGRNGIALISAASAK